MRYGVSPYVAYGFSPCMHADLNTLNEAIKKAEDISDLKAFYTYHPPYAGIEELLESLKKGLSATLSKIDEHLFVL